MEERNPLKTKDTFLAIADWLSPKDIPKLKLVCRDWRRWVDAAPWSWEAQEPLVSAKRWKIEFGYPLKGEKYSMLYQLGETRRPSNTTIVCVREADQAVEIKDVTFEGNAKLRDNVLMGTPGEKVTVIRQLNHQRFAVGYDSGKILIFCLNSLDLLFTISAFNTPVSQVCNVSISKKRRDHVGVLSVREDDLLIAADITGQLSCLELNNTNHTTLIRWSIRDKDRNPIKEIRAKGNGDIDIIVCDDKSNIFIIKTVSCRDGVLTSEPRVIKRPLKNTSETLKRLKLCANNNVHDMAIKNTSCNQNIGVYTYVWNPKTSVFKTECGFFSPDLMNGNGSWLFCQAYALEESFAYVSQFKKSGEESEAQIAYPKRLPITRGALNMMEEEANEVVAETKII